MSWEPLASSDPVPGAPDRIETVASQLAQIADSIGTQAGRLRGASAEAFWTGDAADRFEADKEDLPPLLDIVQERYSEAGSALARYAPELRAAQELARRALAQARTAEADIASAERGIDRMDEYASSERARVRAAAQAYPDRAAPRPVPWSGPNYHYLLGDARADLESARDLLDQAIAQNETAGHAAAIALANAIHDDIRNTFRSRADAALDLAGGAWDAYWDYNADAARWLTDLVPIEEFSAMVGVLSAVVGALAAVAAVVALCFPPAALVAAALGTAALALGAIKLVLDIVLWEASDYDTEKGVALLVDGALLAIGFGIGRVATGAASLTTTARTAAIASPTTDNVIAFARIARYSRDAEQFQTMWDAGGSVLDMTAADTRDDFRTTFDIYRSRPLLWNVPGFLLPGGQVAGPVAAAWLYHNDHRVPAPPAPPPPGSTIAPISPLDPAPR